MKINRNCCALSAIGLGLLGVPCSAQPAGSWTINPANGHYYRLLPQGGWMQSARWATELGGHLVTIGDEQEQNWVFNSFAGGDKQRLLWIGLINRGGRFAWVDGTASTYTNWHVGEPNGVGQAEHYVAMYYAGSNAPGAWNDWDDRNADPIGIPFHGVVEIEP